MADKNDVPTAGDDWPEPRLRALQVEELFRHAPAALAFSYVVAVLTLGVLINTGDSARGTVWFLFATAVAFIRFITILGYRRRSRDSDPGLWARLVIVSNVLAGIQWGLLGSLLFPETGGYRQIFTVMVIACFVGGSLPAYAPVKGAHEALSIPATIPAVVNLFFVQSGIHWFAGLTGLIFVFAIVYYARKLNRQIEDSFRFQCERDELLALTGLLNEKLAAENRDLAHRAAVRGVSMENERERADRLEALFERSPLPQIECDPGGNVITCNAAAERLFGARREDLAGTPITTLIAIPDAPGKGLAGVPEAATLEVDVRRRGGGDGMTGTASFTLLPAPEGRRAGFAVTLSGLGVHAG